MMGMGMMGGMGGMGGMMMNPMMGGMGMGGMAGGIGAGMVGAHPMALRSAAPVIANSPAATASLVALAVFLL